jgi:DNA-directed RNA polymerase subunit H (RpoH/RPB5)
MTEQMEQEEKKEEKVTPGEAQEQLIKDLEIKNDQLRRIQGQANALAQEILKMEGAITALEQFK